MQLGTAPRGCGRGMRRRRSATAQIRSPEGRNPKEGRNPNSETGWGGRAGTCLGACCPTRWRVQRYSVRAARSREKPGISCPTRYSRRARSARPTSRDHLGNTPFGGLLIRISAFFRVSAFGTSDFRAPRATPPAIGATSARVGSRLHPSFLRGPALAHQFEKMRQRLLVTAAFLPSQLPGAPVELGRHLRGFLRWATQPYQDGGQFLDRHPVT
jgi:hypothetical protein